MLWHIRHGGVHRFKNYLNVIEALGVWLGFFLFFLHLSKLRQVDAVSRNSDQIKQEENSKKCHS